LREKYWAFYTRTKFELFYFNEYLNNSYQWLRSLEAFLAAASCGSIAAWAVWDEIPYVWGVIIAVSQVVTAVKQYLPYGKRIQALNNLLPRLDMLVNRIDHEWLHVDKGEFTDDKINDIIFTFRRECADLSNEYLNGVYFPERENLRKAAQVKAESFFDCFCTEVSA
jgi:hypothetical protein